LNQQLPLSFVPAHAVAGMAMSSATSKPLCKRFIVVSWEVGRRDDGRPRLGGYRPERDTPAAELARSPRQTPEKAPDQRSSRQTLEKASNQPAPFARRRH
jgi:hypothetical protein